MEVHGRWGLGVIIFSHFLISLVSLRGISLRDLEILDPRVLRLLLGNENYHSPVLQYLIASNRLVWTKFLNNSLRGPKVGLALDKPARFLFSRTTWFTEFLVVSSTPLLLRFRLNPDYISIAVLRDIVTVAGNGTSQYLAFGVSTIKSEGPTIVPGLVACPIRHRTGPGEDCGMRKLVGNDRVD
ncbi:uncharacterized protein BDR25DRAFT_351725 [Lindgomyces ingoldianus]|uniref:Uncharacterized protein n=1 Tax=Lindgomyces ingoldianus TaxID=673940 RepID=A0ACB6R4V6_9PLEO|nr:uncharacterized protein BDR25DRAFT_351725 [Lindgomyces ingoldianus]KAF2474191.1 hypothetical protein BDR25DRAFT_351725 [Lindgomyces ingoldianus]